MVTIWSLPILYENPNQIGKVQLTCSNNNFSRGSKISLQCLHLLMPLLLSMILQCHRISLPKLILRYVSLIYLLFQISTTNIPSNLILWPILDSSIGDKGRRYTLRVCKQPDKKGFSKPSCNVIYPIYDFVSYYCLSKTHLAFAFQFSSIFIPSHFQNVIEDSKWGATRLEEMNAF